MFDVGLAECGLHLRVHINKRSRWWWGRAGNPSNEYITLKLQHATPSIPLTECSEPTHTEWPLLRYFFLFVFVVHSVAVRVVSRDHGQL